MRQKATRIQHADVPPELLLMNPETAPVADLIIRTTDPLPGEAVLAALDMNLLDDQLQGRLAASLCAPEEQRRLVSFRYGKRKREWLAGRLAAKIACLSLLGDGRLPGPDALPITADAEGRPCLTMEPPPEEQVFLSISHSHRYGIALASRIGPCGVDIQKIVPKIVRISSYFANDQELLLLKRKLTAKAETIRLTMLWAAKEALKKQLPPGRQPPLFHSITLRALHSVSYTSLEGWSFCCSLGEETATRKIEVYIYPDYILAYALEEDHA